MNRQSGFTLIELCVGIAIFAVLVMIAIPNMIRWRTNTQLNTFGREVFSAIQYCRVEAARRNCFVVLDFDDDGNGKVERYVAWADDGEGTADADQNGTPDGAENNVRDGDETVFFEVVLPDNIKIPTLPFGAGLGLTRFNSRAIPSFAGPVTITNPRLGRTINIELYSGGGVEIR